MNNLELLPDRAVLALSGPDASAFLQGVITQDTARLAPGAPIFSCLLTPQGKIQFEFLIFQTDDTLLIDVRAEQAEALARRLTLYRLRAKVDIAQPPNLGVYAVSGDPAFEGAAGADPRHAALGRRGVGPLGQAPGATDYRERRIAAAVPELGEDFQPDSRFLTDVNYDLLAGVSYKKGCFVGQEVTSRMKRKGEARKRTLIAEFADGRAAPFGAPVMAGDSVIGEVMSGAGAKALALVRLDRWDNAKTTGAEVTADGLRLSLNVPAYLQLS